MAGRSDNPPVQLALAVTAATALAATAPSPRALLLRSADLPAGFAGGGAAVVRVSNAAAARDGPPGFLHELRRWHRVVGYRIVFSRPASATGLQEGPLEIRSSASVYESATGAKAALAYTRLHLVPEGTARIALGFPLGDGALEYVSQNASTIGALLVYTVIWRERRVVASVVVVGRVGVVSAADVAPLAQRQDRRIRGQARSR